MAALRVYHRIGAGRPIRVAWMLEEVGADYEVVTMTLEEARGQEHLARHPLGRVPVLEDESGALFESTALVFHIAERYPESGLLPPAGTRDRAIVQGWSIFAMTELEAPAIECRRLREEFPEAAAKAVARCGDAVGVLERALSGRPPHIAGGGFSVADVVVGGVLGVAVRVGAIEPSGDITAYLESLAARPAWQRASAKLGSRGPV